MSNSQSANLIEIMKQVPSIETLVTSNGDELRNMGAFNDLTPEET